MTVHPSPLHPSAARGGAFVPGEAAVHDVMCLTDLSPAGGLALRHASDLARAFGAEWSVYHALETLQVNHPFLSLAVGEELAGAARRRAESSLRRQLVGLQPPADMRIEAVPSAPEAVVEMVVARRPDLTVMATHARHGLAHFVMGSVAEQVLRRARTPVLCLHGAPSAPDAYRRIVVPTDLSPGSRVAFPLAALFARTFGASVIGVHAAPLPSAARTAGFEPTIEVPWPASSIEESYRADFAGLPLRVQVGEGGVWERIVETATCERAGLIVMATRRHDSVADRILGSNAERVLRHAPCPVLIV
jgi:nucleotide-binding universal stress UspA family protein